MAKMKLKEWADKHGLSYLTANRHFHAGMIPGAIQLDSGTILVEDDSPEQIMVGNTSSDTISLFLKKTVEFSKSNATVEDFAAYIISNFQIKVNNGPDGPRYSKQKPKSEDVQKHFQQFIPKGEKPKPNTFVMEPEAFEDGEMPIANATVNHEDLVKDFTQAVNYGSVIAPRNYAQEMFPTNSVFVSITDTNIEPMSSTESLTTRSVDLNTTPQSINYTGSNGQTFGSSSTFTSNTMGGVVSNNSSFAGVTNCLTEPDRICYFNQATPSNIVGSFQPTQKELEAVKTSTEIVTNVPRKRGRKPNKK